MWFYKSLLFSIVSAIIVIVSKKILNKVSATFLTWATLLLATPIIFMFTIKDGLPSLNSLFFIGIIGSVAFYTVAKVIGFKAIRMADLSSIYPLTSLGPIFTLSVALLPPLSEIPKLLAVIGVFITLIGCYILNLKATKKGIFGPLSQLWHNKASLLMLLAILIDSVIIIFDKIAIKNTFPQNTTFTLLIENIVIIFGLLPFLYFRDRNFLDQMFNNTKLFILLGLLNAVATILAFSAVGEGNVSLVKTLMQTEILFVLLLSLFFFKDKPKRETVIGSIIMIVGVLLIKISS